MKPEFNHMKPLFNELTCKFASIVNTVFITLTPFLSIKFYLAFSVAECFSNIDKIDISILSMCSHATYDGNYQHPVLISFFTH